MHNHPTLLTWFSFLVVLLGQDLSSRLIFPFLVSHAERNSQNFRSLLQIGQLLDYFLHIIILVVLDRDTFAIGLLGDINFHSTSISVSISISVNYLASFGVEMWTPMFSLSMLHACKILGVVVPTTTRVSGAWLSKNGQILF